MASKPAAGGRVRKKPAPKRATDPKTPTCCEADRTPSFIETTVKAMEDVRDGKNLTRYADGDELFEKRPRSRRHARFPSDYRIRAERGLRRQLWGKTRTLGQDGASIRTRTANGTTAWDTTTRSGAYRCTTTVAGSSFSLKRCGFTFVGSTICYALMQATGLVNDHLVECSRYIRAWIELRSPRRIVFGAELESDPQTRPRQEFLSISIHRKEM